MLFRSGADLVVVETPGIGQGDAAIVPHVDIPMYVMTPEFGASTQLEKIDMLDHARIVVINKFERRGAADALRDVRRQYARNHELFHVELETLPVFGTVAARFNDDGVTAVYQHLKGLLAEAGLVFGDSSLTAVDTSVSTHIGTILPTSRQRYLSEISDTVRRYHDTTTKQATAVRTRQQLNTAAELVEAAGHDASGVRATASAAANEIGRAHV